MDSPTILDFMLVMLVSKQNQREHVQIPLLFPATRSSGITNQRTNIVAMIYKAVDKMKRDFDIVQLNLATALILPIKAVLQPSHAVNKLPLRTPQLTVANLYRQHPRHPSQLKARKPATIPQDVRPTSNKILKLIKTSTIQLQLFERSLQPRQDSPNLSTNINLLLFTESLNFNNQQGLQHSV